MISLAIAELEQPQRIESLWYNLDSPANQLERSKPMSKTWQLQEAKNKFSEVVECAIHEGPQTVSRRGEDAVVILSCTDYERLKGGKKNLAEFLRQSPLVGVELDLERPRDLPRDFTL